MRLSLPLFLIALGLSTGRAQVAPQIKPDAHSHSGQFLAYRMPQLAVTSTRIATNAGLTRLEPTFLVVSCERIKQAVLTRLGARDNWRGRITLVLHRARTGDEDVVVTTEKFMDRWNYRVDLPDAIEPARLVRTMTQVVLLEMANRNSKARTAELPAWLAEGLPELLMASSAVDFVIKPPTAQLNNLNLDTVSREGRAKHPLASAQTILATRTPMSFEELCWPKSAQLVGEQAEIFRSSALIFVHELLRLKNGQAALREFVLALPIQLNWQLCFLQAFRSEFPGMLEVEKWWALQTAHFSGRDLAQTWTAEESWKKLENIIHSDVQVHIDASRFPFRTEVSLQVIIREWDYLRQTQTLPGIVRQLKEVQLRVAPELLTLTSQYRQTLEDYLARMQKAGPLPIGNVQTRQSIRNIIQETLKQLDALDAKGRALRTMPIAQQNSN